MSHSKKYFKKLSVKPPYAPLTRRLVSERGTKDLPPGTKGGETMTPDRHKDYKQKAFDSFCKKVLKCEAFNGYRDISRRQAREVSFSELPEETMAQLAVYDRYSWEYTPFPIRGGYVILIENDALAEALSALEPEDRDIFLMYWFLDMLDRDIADQMHMARRTVNDRRHKAYRLLKELMGGDAD